MPNENIPLTVVSGTRTIQINWGGTYAPVPQPHPNTFYHLLVLDRANLAIVANELCSDCATVPAAVQKYDGDPRYLLLAASFGLIPSMHPQGDLLRFLGANGPGKGLAKAVQICQVLDPATNYLNYGHIGVMGTREGMDGYSFDMRTPLALPMHLVVMGGLYTPVDDY